jgi:prepilin-type N-terminal cleavage/methylation domain-containing protein
MARCPNSASPRPPRGFTLVEMLVVIAIIVILMALLIPVTMGVISRARNAAIAVEIRELKVALEKYKETHGDYPPSMGGPPAQWLPGNRYQTVAEKHLLRCYPKMTPVQKNFFYDYIAWQLDNDESLVFWLGLIADDPREPFKNFTLDGSNNLIFTPTPGSPAGTVGVYPGPYTRHVHFDFDERRLFDAVTPQDVDPIPAYRALYARDTPYIYFDSRTYFIHMHPSTSALGVCQPYMDYAKVQATLSNASLPPNGAFVNPNTFQIHCAGQDGDYGGLAPAVDPTNGFTWNTNWQAMVKTFPNMTGQYCNEEDSDNIADFTEGARLIDKRP